MGSLSTRTQPDCSVARWCKLSDYNNLDALPKALAETKSAFLGGLETVPVEPQLPLRPVLNRLSCARLKRGSTSDWQS